MIHSVQRYIPKDVHGSVFYNNKNNEKKSKSIPKRLRSLQA